MRRLVLSIVTGFLGLCAAVPSASARGPYPYAHVDAGCDALAFNQPVQVLWGSSWWEATVVATQGPSTLVHYVGWSSSWDEWVDPSRLRVVVSLAPAAPIVAQPVAVQPYDAPYVWSLPHNTPRDSAARWHRVRAERGYRFQYSR